MSNFGAVRHLGFLMEVDFHNSAGP